MKEYPVCIGCNLVGLDGRIIPHGSSCPFTTFTAEDLAACRRAFPTDPAGQVDKGLRVDGAKLCLQSIKHENMVVPSATTTYCSLRLGHTGQCSGPIPRELERNTFDKGKARK